MINNKIYSFTRLIKKYSIDFEYQLVNDDTSTDSYDDLGNNLNDVVFPRVKSHGALIPPSKIEIYQSGGRLTSSNRILYISEHDHPAIDKFPPKTKIFHDNMTYFVEGEGDFLDFGDFTRYVLKAVSSFG